MTHTMPIPQTSTDHAFVGVRPSERFAQTHLEAFVREHINAIAEILDACLGDVAGSRARNLADLALLADTDIPALAVAAAAVLDDFNTIGTSPALVAPLALRTVSSENLEAAIRFNGARVDEVFQMLSMIQPD